jgi:signal transduction histidine kinase
MPKGIQCQWSGLDDLEKEDERLMLRCNDTCLRQIILNLLKNASDAMEGSGEVTIHVKRCNKGECLENAIPALCIEISDTGCGIDEETKQRIFEPFFTTKDISEGTGLGLASVYSLMQQHDGDVKVESELGKGTTFTLVFPVSVHLRNKN